MHIRFNVSTRLCLKINCILFLCQVLNFIWTKSGYHFFSSTHFVKSNKKKEKKEEKKKENKRNKKLFNRIFVQFQNTIFLFLYLLSVKYVGHLQPLNFVLFFVLFCFFVFHFRRLFIKTVDFVEIKF